MNKITLLIELVLWLSLPFWIRPALRSFGFSEEFIQGVWEGGKFVIVALFLFFLLVTVATIVVS